MPLDVHTLSHGDALVRTLRRSNSGAVCRLILLWEGLTFSLKIHLWFLPLDL